MLGLGTAIVTSGTVLDSALLDDFGGAAVGYSVRRLNGDYYGPCMRVRRDSDNAERDIYFGTDDVLDTTTLEDFCDGTDGYVVRWYNQTESYESVKLLDQSYASSPEAAYSVRKLDSSYDGPCMEVASSDDVIGFRMTADLLTGGQWLRYNVGGVPYTGGDTTWTAEMYVDAPSHIAENKAFRIRGITKGSSGTLFGTFGVVNPVEQKKWKKVTWTFSEAPTETFIQLQHDQGAGTQLRKGDQVLFRNIEATGYTAVYDENNYLVSDASTAEVIKGYNIPFTADGDLDEAKIVEHGYASPFECLEIDVVDTTDATGNYWINIPGADTITGDPSASGTYTVTTEIYVDCPSISGAVTFKGQIGAATRNFDEGNTVAQKQWVTKTMSLTVGTSNVQSRIYFAGTGQAPQELEEGDKIYFRRIVLNHSEDSTYNAELDFTSSADGVTYAFPSGGDGDATLSHGKAPAEELGVITWYDQSGNGNDATQTTFSNTPQVYQYNSTTKDYRVVKENDRSAIEFESGELLGFDNTDTYDELSVFVAAIKPTTQANSPFVSKLGNGAGSGTKKGDFHLRSQSAFIRTIAGNTDGSQYVYTEPDTHSVFSFLWDGSVQSAVDSPLGDGEAVVRIDSTIVDQTAIDGNFNGGTDQFRINATHTVATDLGRYQEVIVFSEYLPNGRQSIEDNIDAHFRITNDLDATQSDDANQLQVVDDGSTVTEGGQPALFKHNQGAIMDFGSALVNGSDFLYAVVHGPFSDWGRVAGPTFLGPRNSNNYRHDYDSGLVNKFNDTSVDVVSNQVLATSQRVSTTSASVFINGLITSNGEVTAGSNVASTQTTIFSTDRDVTGKVQEFLFYDSNESSNRSNIEDNINEFYSIYDKSSYRLLDYYPDAAAAFSLRKLLSTYTGDAIEVRRDSDNTTQDIGFDANGNLDTAALAAFCGSSNGFVETWYNQSVNGNDATQATPANQPKIYDATTGVIKDNGKPATEWSGATNQLLDTSYTTDSSEFTVVAVANADENATNKTIVLAPEALVFVSNNESLRHIQGDGVQTVYGPADSTDQILHFVGNSGSESFAGDNGTAFTTRSESPATNSKLRIGANSNGLINFLGTIQEIVYYTSDKSGSRSDIEANVNRYYSIY